MVDSVSVSAMLLQIALLLQIGNTPNVLNIWEGSGSGRSEGGVLAGGVIII